MVAQKPRATGTLGGTPIANLLIYMLDHRLTGTLVIEDPEHQKCAIAFAGGAPTKVKLPEPFALLSEVLVSTQAIDAATSAASWQVAQAQKKLHGVVLVEDGLVDAEVLAEALAEQVARKAEWLCRLGPESLFGYYDGQDLLETYGSPESPPMEPLGIIWRTVRASADPAGVDATLARLGGRDVRLHPRSRAGRFGFTARERGMIDVLRVKPQPVSSLVASELLPPDEIKRILYMLAITRHLDLGGATLPVGVGQSSSGIASAARPRAESEPGLGGTAERAAPLRDSASRDSVGKATVPNPPRSASEVTWKSAEEEAFREELRARAETIGSQNYYEILGVDRSAPTTVIQGAFFQLAKRWHPDRVPAELADLREQSVRLFARMSEAHQVLTNDEQRQEYERLMKEGGASADDQEIVQRVLRAITAFQKAEIFVRRGNLDEAEKQAALAVESDSEQAEYLALYADLLSQKVERTESGDHKSAVQMVNDAKRREPGNLKVRLHRARVLKRSGEVASAHKEFRSIVEQDAHNVEAAREVRLYEMRKGKSGTDPKRTSSDAGNAKSGAKERREGSELGQLFGKLFKR